MGKYQIAGLTVDFQNQYSHLEMLCKDYLCQDNSLPEITIRVSQEEIEKENTLSQGQFPPGYLESICAYRRFCLEMLKFDGMFFHSAVIQVNGKGIAFSAVSGTGKTTHLRLWQEMLGEELTIVNGDKPIVRYEDGIPYAYGTPWAGKENLHTNTKTPLTDICFLERSAHNFVEPLQPGDCIAPFMQQIVRPNTPFAAMKTLELADKLLKDCRLWRLGCNMEIDAAQTAYTAIFGT